MTTLKQIMTANYEAVKGRGLIDDETTLPDFITKLQEEIGEFIKAKDEAEAAAELADVVGVCLNIASHYEIDLPTALEEMVSRNEDRKAMPTKQIISHKNGAWTVLIDNTYMTEISKSLYYKKEIQIWGIGYVIVTDCKRAPDGLVVDLIRSRI